MSIVWCGLRNNLDLSVENVYLLLDLPGFGGGAEIAGGHQGGSDGGHHVRILPGDAWTSEYSLYIDIHLEI